MDGLRPHLSQSEQRLVRGEGGCSDCASSSSTGFLKKAGIGFELPCVHMEQMIGDLIGDPSTKANGGGGLSLFCISMNAI